MGNPFQEFFDDLKDSFRDIVREELRALSTDKNGVNTDEYLTVVQTAKFLDCSKPHVYKLKERIPYSKIGPRVYFKVEDLQKYMERGRVANVQRYA